MKKTLVVVYQLLHFLYPVIAVFRLHQGKELLADSLNTVQDGVDDTRVRFQSRSNQSEVSIIEIDQSEVNIIIFDQ